MDRYYRLLFLKHSQNNLSLLQVLLVCHMCVYESLYHYRTLHYSYRKLSSPTKYHLKKIN